MSLFASPHRNEPEYKGPNVPAGPAKVVAMGLQGAGKTSLLNKIASSAFETSAGTASCTRVNQEGKVVAPNGKEVTIVDTPGLGAQNIAYADAHNVKIALTKHRINHVWVVLPMPMSNRVDPFLDQLTQCFDPMFDCDTFSTDSDGHRLPLNSPNRFKVTLVLTHRDRSTLPESEFPTFARRMWELPWVGDVCFIGLETELQWLQQKLLLPLTTMESRHFSITGPEFASNFPIARNLTNEEKSVIKPIMRKYDKAVDSAIEELEFVVQDRKDKATAHGVGGDANSGSGSFIERVGPAADCVLRFLDDAFGSYSREALAKLEAVPEDELFATTDEHLNKHRLARWEAVKQFFGPSFKEQRRSVMVHWPVDPDSAIYKKCPHCGAVYVKPVGCDFGTTCGNSAGGLDSQPLSYDFDKTSGRFKIKFSTGLGVFEQQQMSFRSQFSRVQAGVMDALRAMRSLNGFEDYVEFNEYGDRDEKAGFEKGCRKPISWYTMTPLTPDELKYYHLIPNEVQHVDIDPKEAKSN